MEEAFYNDSLNSVTNREGILNIQSLIHNQLSSPQYRDMILYAWRNTDPNFNRGELSSYPPKMVSNIQFEFDAASRCQVPGCSRHAFIKCAHCGKLLCHHHFINRTCVHNAGGLSRSKRADEDYHEQPAEMTTIRPVGAPSETAVLGTAGMSAITSLVALGVGAYVARQTTPAPDEERPDMNPPESMPEERQRTRKPKEKKNRRVKWRIRG